MATNIYDPLWTEKITVPVKRVGANWEFLYGGDVPVKEGTIADLVVSSAQVTDAKFLKMMNQEAVAQILPQGSILLVALSDPKSHSAWTDDIAWKDVIDLPLGATRLEKIVIGPKKSKGNQQHNLEENNGGLWLKLKGLEKSELVCSTVMLTNSLADKTASSLNHAFTMLSEHFETHRISHTGNVYSRVFYQEENKKWYPLSRLRDGIRVNAESTVIAKVWEEIELELGWCRLPPLDLLVKGNNRQDRIDQKHK